MSNSTESCCGKVRKLMGQYGFIAGDDGVDYFFHWTSMRKGGTDFRKLEVLDRVSFEPKQLPPQDGKNRFRALEVDLVRSN